MLTIIPCCSQILASSNPNRILHNLELLYAIMDQKWVADVGDSIDWLSVVVLKLANLSKKKKNTISLIPDKPGEYIWVPD